MSKQEKALELVEHIERHLEKMFPDDAKVICKICGKTIDEIWDERG